MAKVGAQRAAELTGRSKSTVQRAMKSGKLSYEIDANDRRVIDVAELERVFGLMPQESDRKTVESAQVEIEKATQAMENERLKMRIRMLEDQLDASRESVEDLKAQRDLWQRQAQQVLLTSQYSQRQADEYKEKLEEHERLLRQRRQNAMEQQRRQQPASAPQQPGAGAQGAARSVTNENRKVGPMEKQRTQSGGIQGFFGRLRGQSRPAAKTGGNGKVA